MNPLEQRLKYKFRNTLLLAEALTHPSLGHETKRHHFDNQRLEFLGDAVLQLIFTEYLFDQFPHLAEGYLTKIRARIVSRDGLRVLAEQLELGRYLMMGRGEEANGGRERASTLSDAFEALIGAMYLDSDFVSVRRVVLTEAREFLRGSPSTLRTTIRKAGCRKSSKPSRPSVPATRSSTKAGRSIRKTSSPKSSGKDANSDVARAGAKKRRRSPPLAPLSIKLSGKCRHQTPPAPLSRAPPTLSVTCR